MKKIKKLLALVMAMTMVLGMGLTAFAANGLPEKSDTAEVKITDLTGNPTVTLYQIASVEYGDNDKGFVKYNWADEGLFINEAQPTANEINAIAQRLLSESSADNHLIPLNTPSSVQVTGSEFSARVSAGAYIAVITRAADGRVYNPILLTATYGSKDTPGDLTGGIISADAKYLWGSSAVAKSTMPGIVKDIKEGATEDGNKNTASVGDVLTFTVTPTMPNYPSNAANKTFFISDTMDAGLTFIFDSLQVAVNTQDVIKDGNAFKLNDKVIATAHATENGFNLNFNYDNLISDDTTGAVYTPVVTYKAVINQDAVVGTEGNSNNVELYYANNPNAGGTWDNVNEKPESATGITSKSDSETVYTYQLGFRKVDSENEGVFLSDAVFGIYKDPTCTELVDIVKTNSLGYAFSTKVAAGIYYIKELVAPTGYTLNETVYSVTASWDTATTTVTGEVTDCTYTTTKPSDDAVQVGWIKDNVFYALDEVTSGSAAQDGYAAAYIDEENVTSTTVTTVTKNQDAGSGSVMLDNNIPNTTIASLPSTGGIGTTIFTIGGCVIMIAAAALFFVNRRKSEEN